MGNTKKGKRKEKRGKDERKQRRRCREERGNPSNPHSSLDSKFGCTLDR